MIYSHHCYNHRWRQQMWATYMQATTAIGVADHHLLAMKTINSAEDLLAADLDSEALGEAFTELNLEEQARYLDLVEMACPWLIIGLEH